MFIRFFVMEVMYASCGKSALDDRSRNHTGKYLVSTVFHIYSDWYISLALIAAALPIMAAIITDAYVRQLNNFKFKVIVCTVMLALLIVRTVLKIFM